MSRRPVTYDFHPTGPGGLNDFFFWERRVRDEGLMGVQWERVGESYHGLLFFFYLPIPINPTRHRTVRIMYLYAAATHDNCFWVQCESCESFSNVNWRVWSARSSYYILCTRMYIYTLLMDFYVWYHRVIKIKIGFTAVKLSEWGGGGVQVLLMYVV